MLRHDKTTVHLNINKRVNIDSPSNLNDHVNCEVESIKKEINNDESVDDPNPIHQETENKDEDLYDYDRIDIQEFKIEPGDVNINEESADQNNINNVNELDNNLDEDMNDSKILNDITVENSDQNHSYEVNNLVDNVNVNNMDEEGNDDVNNIEENVNEIEGNVNEVEGNVNEVEGNVNEAEGNVNEVEGNVNEVEGNANVVEGNVNEFDEGNVVGQENINFQALQNLTVEEALAFFSS